MEHLLEIQNVVLHAVHVHTCVYVIYRNKLCGKILVCCLIIFQIAQGWDHQ